MYYFNGDTVKLVTGESAEIIDSWGVARTWYQLKSADGQVIYAMAEQIESVVKRYSTKKKKWG